MFCCFSGRNDTYCIGSDKGMDNEDDSYAQEANGYKSLFVIFKSVILERDGLPIKNMNHVQEIKAVSTDVSPSLGFIPLEFH